MDAASYIATFKISRREAKGMSKNGKKEISKDYLS